LELPAGFNEHQSSVIIGVINALDSSVFCIRNVFIGIENEEL
jgi:hypothetical protein